MLESLAVAMDVHAEAQQRFTEDTRPAIVSRGEMTTADVLKGVIVGEMAIDLVQTHDFIRKGTCRELDPWMRPVVHYTPFDVLTKAAMAYGVVSVRPHTFASRVLLPVFAALEGANVERNHAVGCE